MLSNILLLEIGFQKSCGFFERPTSSAGASASLQVVVSDSELEEILSNFASPSAPRFNVASLSSSTSDLLET